MRDGAGIGRVGALTGASAGRPGAVQAQGVVVIQRSVAPNGHPPHEGEGFAVLPRQGPGQLGKGWRRRWRRSLGSGAARGEWSAEGLDAIVKRKGRCCTAVQVPAWRQRLNPYCVKHLGVAAGTGPQSTRSAEPDGAQGAVQRLGRACGGSGGAGHARRHALPPLVAQVGGCRRLDAGVQLRQLGAGARALQQEEQAQQGFECACGCCAAKCAALVAAGHASAR